MSLHADKANKYKFCIITSFISCIFFEVSIYLFFFTLLEIVTQEGHIIGLTRDGEYAVPLEFTPRTKGKYNVCEVR